MDASIKRAKSREEIIPLITLCKEGRLFDVQEWIKAGKPVNAPLPPPKGQWPKTPLQYAITSGFHSLVQVLLEGGADLTPERRYNPLKHAITAKKHHIVKLLLNRGADPKSVDMSDVFDTWDSDLMRLFIELGADIFTHNPFAYAFQNKIQTSLGVYLKYKETFPELKKQVDIGLRYHCRNKSSKWVSIMLWAGADPYSRGTSDYWEDDCFNFSAQEFAMIFHNPELLKIKGMELNPDAPNIESMIEWEVDYSRTNKISEILALGYKLNNLENGGCRILSRILKNIRYVCSRKRKNIDKDWIRSRLRMVHFFAQKGAKWIPEKDGEIESIRSGFLSLIPEYTLELIWMTYRYGIATQETIIELVSEPSMIKHLRGYKADIITIHENFIRYGPDDCPGNIDLSCLIDIIS